MFKEKNRLSHYLRLWSSEGYLVKTGRFPVKVHLHENSLGVPDKYFHNAT
jgi:hypothetical protein